MTTLHHAFTTSLLLLARGIQQTNDKVGSGQEPLDPTQPRPVKERKSSKQKRAQADAAAAAAQAITDGSAPTATVPMALPFNLERLMAVRVDFTLRES